MWGRYLEIGLVWCGLVLHCSPRLIMSGLSNGCLGLGRAAWLPDKSPPNFSSRLWTGMVSGNLSEFLVVNSKLCVQLRLIDLCKRIKLKETPFLFSISDPFNTTAGFCFFLPSAACVQALCPTPCDLASSHQCPPKPSFPVWSQLNWMKNMAPSLPDGWIRPLYSQRANLLISTYITSRSDRRSHSVLAPVTLSFPPDKWNNGSGPLWLREPGFDLNPGTGWCPTADRETSVCAEPESLRRPVCV